MSAVTKHYCDWKGCKRERVGRTLKVFSHTSSDPSGNGSNKWEAAFDLCAEHVMEYVDQLAENVQGYGRFGAVKPRTPFEIVKELQIHFEIE